MLSGLTRRAGVGQAREICRRSRAMPDAESTDARAEFARLYPPLAPALHAWACLRLGGGEGSKLSPEDLTQEIWLRAYQSFSTFDAQKGSFRGWLFAVGKNVLLEARRRLRRSGKEQAAQGSSTRMLQLDEMAIDMTSVTHRVVKDEQVQQFVARIAQLEEVERMTVLHCGLEELSVGDASMRLGESYDATAKRWQRLRERIRGWGEPLGMFSGS